MKRILICTLVTLLLLSCFTVATAEETKGNSDDTPVKQTDITSDSQKNECLTVKNCEDLAALACAEYPYDELMSDFAEKYSGKTIEIDGYIYDPGLGVVSRDIEVRLGDASASTPHFLIEAVTPKALGMNEGFPDFIDYSRNVRVQGIVREYDSFHECILLDLIRIEARNPLLDGLDTSAYTETFEKGSKGDGVKSLQQRLIDLYYLNDVADGSYGNKTKAAVEKFQKACELEPTGIADPITLTLLYSDRAPEAELSVSCSSIVVGSSAKTAWYVDGQNFTLTGNQTKTIKTVWGTYKFDAFGNYVQVD